jgi:hypothetical protein
MKRPAVIKTLAGAAMAIAAAVGGVFHSWPPEPAPRDAALEVQVLEALTRARFEFGRLPVPLGTWHYQIEAIRYNDDGTSTSVLGPMMTFTVIPGGAVTAADPRWLGVDR